MKGISEVSKLTGVSRRTLQYYDDEGLLLVERSLNNHRIFDQQDLVRIWEILVYKEIQFELKEIKNILNQDKEVCIVSPDLHKREYKKVWNIYRNINGIMLCTDYPMEAKEFFNVKN